MQPDISLRESFVGFVREVEPALRRALVALYGPDDGREATAEALLYGWEHWKRIDGMRNSAGYLFRVGQTWARRNRRSRPQFPSPPASYEPWVEPALPQALQGLSRKQRTAVGLKHGSDWTYDEVAMFMGISVSSVRKHVERALKKLRTALEVTDGS